MTIHEILQEMTFEEKVLLLTGAGRMSTYGIERLGIPPEKNGGRASWCAY